MTDRPVWPESLADQPPAVKAQLMLSDFSRYFVQACGEARAEQEEVAKARERSCPTCGAEPRRWCRNVNTGELVMLAVHGARKR